MHLRQDELRRYYSKIFFTDVYFRKALYSFINECIQITVFSLKLYLFFVPPDPERAVRGATASVLVTRGRSGRRDETEFGNLEKTTKYKHKQNILLK